MIRILEALCDSPEPVSLADLSRALGTPKSSLAALLRGLADESFVLAVEGGWRLGPGAFGLSSAIAGVRRRLQSSDLVREAMRRLAAGTGETALFAVRDGDSGTMTYIDVVESTNAVRFAVAIGDRRPLYATAGGRAMLAAAGEETVAAYLASLNPASLTRATETDRARIAAAIVTARRAGVAQTIDQAAEGVTGTAAAVRDGSGRPLGALIVAAPSARLQDRLAELAALVKAEAEAISRSLGYRG